MLHFITWAGFGKLMLVLLVIYYGYWGIMFIKMGREERKLRKEREQVNGFGDAAEGREGEPEAAGAGVPLVGTVGIRETANDGTLAVSGRSSKESKGDPEWERKLARELAVAILEQVEDAVVLGYTKERLMEAIRNLFSGKEYEILKEGPFRRTVLSLVNFEIERRLKYRFTAEEANDLWEREAL